MTIDELVSFQAREERLIRSTSGAIEKMLQAKLSISDKWFAGDQGPRIQRGHDHGRRNTLRSNERRYEMLQVECNNCYKFDYYAFGQEFCAQLVGTS